MDKDKDLIDELLGEAETTDALEDISADDGTVEKEEGVDVPEDGESEEKSGESTEYMLPEELKGNTEIVDFAKNAGLSQAQLDASIQFYTKLQTTAEEQYTNQLKEETKQLKEEWGTEFDSNIKLSKEAVKMLDKESPGMVAFLRESGASRNPKVIKIFAAVGRLLAAKKSSTDKSRRLATTGEETNKAKKGKAKNGWDVSPFERLHPKN